MSFAGSVYIGRECRSPLRSGMESSAKYGITSWLTFAIGLRIAAAVDVIAFSQHNKGGPFQRDSSVSVGSSLLC